MQSEESKGSRPGNVSDAILAMISDIDAVVPARMLVSVADVKPLWTRSCTEWVVVVFLTCGFFRVPFEVWIELPQTPTRVFLLPQGHRPGE